MVILGTVNDVLIAAILVLSLNRNRSGVSRTDKIVEKLVAYTVSKYTPRLTIMLNLN